MKILILSSEFPPGPGGIGAHAYNLMIQFRKHGNEVVVYAPDRASYESKHYDANLGARIIRYHVNSIPPVRFFHLVKNLVTSGSGYDWVVLSGLRNLALYGVVRGLLRARILCIVHGHEVLMASGVSRLLVKLSLRKADRVVSVSDFSKEIIRNNGISRSVITIPNGVNFYNKVKSKTRATEKVVLITVGSVTKRKGQHNVVNALPALLVRFGMVEYHIVGIPHEQMTLEAQAKKLNVSHCIFFHGAVSDDQRDHLIRQADIFIMLSENLPDGDVEGFGIAILEANGLGLPAIGAEGTGVEQAINHGVNGNLVDAKNADEIANSVALITNEYESYSSRAILWAQQHDWSIIGYRYLDILTIDSK